MEFKVKTIKEGEGGVVSKPGDNLSVHYVGMLEDGQKFDSSYDRGQPLQFKIGIGQVIEGFEKGLVGISPGSKVRLEIPSDMAYGESGAGEVIPPNANLIFEVELVSID